MNTEAINTLKQIRDGVNVIQIELNDPTLTTDDKGLLFNAMLALNKLEDIIINNSLQAMVDKINATSDELKQLIADMQASVDKIAKLSAVIQKISNTVAVLADITTKAIAVGIV